MAFDERTALVVVDVQNDFAHPDGSLYVSGGDEIIPAINRLIDEARRSGALVVYTQDWHPRETPHFAVFGGIWPVHCVHDTWGARFHDALDADGPVLRKGTGGEDGYSGFTHRDVTTGADQPTGLEALLRRHGIDRVVIIGLAEDYCVLATALDAVRLGFDTAVDLGATRAVDVEPGDDRRAREAMAAAGVTLHAAWRLSRE